MVSRGGYECGELVHSVVYMEYLEACLDALCSVQATILKLKIDVPVYSL